jgi:probable rRNA maturation factor
MMLEIALDADEEWDSSSGLRVAWDQLVRRAAEAAIAESAFPQLASAERPIELSVRLTSDDQVQALNARWRGRDKPTNVLSFPMLDQSELDQANFAGQEMLLGDIIMAHGVCTSEAADKNIPVEQHAAHLLIHGTLHLLGYDHQDDEQATDMEQRETRALERLGIADPYLVAA